MNADRAPQLKPSVRLFLLSQSETLRQRIYTHRNVVATILLALSLVLLSPPGISGRPRFSIKDWVTGLAYSPDGKLIAVGGLNGRKAYMLDAGTWKVLHTLEHRYEGGSELVFSPSGKLLASVANGLDEVAVYFWDVTSGKLISTFAERELVQFGQRLMVSAISFSPDGKVLAVGLNNGLVRLLNVENVSAPRTVNPQLVGLDTGISSVNFSLDGSLLMVSTGKGVSGPNDWGILTVVKIQTGVAVANFSKLGYVYASSYSPSKHLLALAVNQGALLIDTTSWTVSRTIRCAPGSKLAFARAVPLLVCGSTYGRQVHILNLEHSQIARSVNLKSVSALALSPDDKAILVGSQDGHIRVYPLKR